MVVVMMVLRCKKQE